MGSLLVLSLLAAAAAAEADARSAESGSTTSSLDPADVPAPTGPATRPAGDAPPDPDVPWIRRWAPVRNTAELGAYGGVYVPAEGHELFDPETTAGTTPQELNAAAGTVGGRVGFLPSRFLGLEVEGGAAPSHTVDDRRATLWHVRGSVVGQVGLWSVVPFGLAGVGGLGVSSDALGRDVDATFHFGAGVKINANARVQIRVDARDVLAARRGVADGVNAAVVLSVVAIMVVNTGITQVVNMFYPMRMG